MQNFYFCIISFINYNQKRFTKKKFTFSESFLIKIYAREVITNYLLITHYALRIMHYLKISQGYFNIERNYNLAI